MNILITVALGLSALAASVLFITLCVGMFRYFEHWRHDLDAWRKDLDRRARAREERRIALQIDRVRERLSDRGRGQMGYWT